MRPLTLFISLLIFSNLSFANTIKNVKGQKVLIIMDQTQFSVGEKVFGVSDGKRRALLQVSAVRNNQAVAVILKGTATPGMSVEPSPLAKKQAPPPSQSVKTVEAPAAKSHSEKQSETPEPFLGQTYGLLLGITQNSMSLQAQYKPPSSSTLAADLSMSGIGFTIKGFGDYSLNEQFNIRYGAGLETFDVKGSARTSNGSAVCSEGTSADCKVNIMYVGADGALQYNLSNDKSRMWVGMGYSFLFAASKSINVENLKNPSTNQILFISFGYDWRRTPKSFIPFQFDYSYIPGAGVTTNGITLRSGFTF